MSKTYVVRFGQMRQLGEYTGLADQEHPRGQRVVVRSDRGTELGEVLCPATDRTALFLENPVQGQILRPASPEDLAAEAALAELQQRGLRHLPGVHRQATTPDGPGRRRGHPRP